MAINNDRTVSLIFEALLSPNSRIVVPRPSFIYCRPLAIVTSNIPIVVGAGGRSGFELGTSSLHTTVAPGAGLLMLPFPGGPANTVVREGSLRRVTRIVERRGLFMLSSRVCYRLACNGGGRISVTRVSNVCRHAVIMGNFSGSCTVAN